jgi:putative cell wall-binding protein
MKVNRKLMIISMVIIAFLAVGAVSASENVTNDLETADFHETITVDDNLNDAVAADDESEKFHHLKVKWL